MTKHLAQCVRYKVAQQPLSQPQHAVRSGESRASNHVACMKVEARADVSAMLRQKITHRQPEPPPGFVQNVAQHPLRHSCNKALPAFQLRCPAPEELRSRPPAMVAMLGGIAAAIPQLSRRATSPGFHAETYSQGPRTREIVYRDWKCRRSRLHGTRCRAGGPPSGVLWRTTADPDIQGIVMMLLSSCGSCNKVRSHWVCCTRGSSTSKWGVA